MTPRDALRSLVAATPPEAVLTVPRAWLADLLAEGDTPTPERADLTAAALAARWNRGASTVRTMCDAGELEGAYKFRGREWRIPWGTVERYELTQRDGGGQGPRGPADPFGIRAIVRGKRTA